MTDKTICRNDGRCEYAIQSGAEKQGRCPAGKCAMPCDNAAAHLTIPGALEWDGDNGTHGADGESRAHGESAPALAIVDESDDGLFIEILYGEDGSPLRRGDKLYGRPSDRGYVSKLAYEAVQKERDDLRAQLANTEQLRRSFFDLSQDLEKRLAERDVLMNRAVQAWAAAETINNMDSAMAALRDALSASAELSAPKCCEPTADELASLAAGDYTPEELWGGSKPTCPKCHKAESSAPADDIPDFTPGSGNKAKRRIAAIEAAKPKTCIECDQPYCHGVCVERGDQDYDRDQAAKGGEQ